MLRCYIICAQRPCTDPLNLTRFASRFTELLQKNRASVIYSEFFRAPCRPYCRKNIELDLKKMFCTSLPPRLLLPRKVCERSNARRLWMRKYGDCMSVTLRGRRAVCSRGRSLNDYGVTVYRSILMQFSPVFAEEIALSNILGIARFRYHMAPQLSRNCGRKSLASTC